MLEKLGIGIDIVEIKRFLNKPYETNNFFYEKIFHPSEIEHCLKRKNAAECFAGKFAIKESVIKSISTNIDFLDILIDYSNFPAKHSAVFLRSRQHVISESWKIFL